MKKNNSLKALQEILSDIQVDIIPLCRVEYLTGFVGYGLIMHGAIKGNGKEIIIGIAVSALSGFYGAYKDGCFSR